MSWRLLIRPEAERDLAKARDWYAQKHAGLGEAFLDVVAAALFNLKCDPQRTRLYFLNFRRVLLPRFPTRFSIKLTAT